MKTNDPDENVINNSSEIDSVCCAVEEAATNLKKVNDKTFSGLHLNAGSLSQNFESLKELLTTIKFEFKVIYLTEPWCTGDSRNKTLFNLTDYKSINQVRKHDRGDGVCVFIHSTLTFKLKSDLATNNNDMDNDMTMPLAIEIINKKTNMLSLVHSIGNQPVILNNVKRIFEISLIKQKNLTRQYTYETNVKVKYYLYLLFQINFIPVINKPTRVSRSNATIIDHINANHFLNNDMHSGIITADISDHFLIFLISKDLMSCILATSQYT